MAAGHFGERSCVRCARQEDLKEVWQCEPGPEKFVMFRGIKDWEQTIDQCPHALITADTARVWALYNLHQRDRFPLTCEVMDIPKKMRTAFGLIDQYMEDLKIA